MSNPTPQTDTRLTKPTMPDHNPEGPHTVLTQPPFPPPPSPLNISTHPSISSITASPFVDISSPVSNSTGSVISLVDSKPTHKIAINSPSRRKKIDRQSFIEAINKLDLSHLKPDQIVTTPLMDVEGGQQLDSNGTHLYTVSTIGDIPVQFYTVD